MVFRKSLLSSSIALALVGVSAPAFAQDDGAVIEEIVVEGGIRGSLKRSMDIKREAMGVVDAISAEDIGKFPDANLAESLQRITGVSISRSRGEGSQVTVRGFGPEYNLVTLNGRQMPTHNGASRSFDFGDLASEGVAGVQVYKTGRADVPSGGVGSTINISTPRPLEADPTSSISLKSVNDTSTRVGDEYTPEFSGIYMDTFADGTIGLAVIASRQERNNGVNAASTGGWYTRPGDDIMPNGSKDPKLATDENQVNRPTTADTNYSLPQSMAYNIAEYRSERTNGQVVLQMAPSDSVTMTLDYIRSEYDLERSYSDLSAWFSNTAAVSQTSQWTDGPISSPVFYSEVVNNADFAMGTGEDGRTNTNESLGLNFDWYVNDELTLNLDWHDSSAKTGANSPNGTSSLITMASFNKVGQTIITGSEMPIMVLNLNSGGEADRPMYKNDMIITGSTFTNDAAKMDIEQTKFSGTWDFSDESSIDFGVQISEVDNRAVSNFIQLNNWGGITNPGDLADIVVRSSIDGQFDQLSGSDHPDLQTEYFTASLDDLIAAGEAAYVASGDDYEAVGDCGTGYCASTDWLNDISTLEESTAAYVRYNLNTELQGMPVNLHMGLRYEETDVTSEARSIEYDGSRWSQAGNELYVTQKDGDGFNPTPFLGSYDFVLPSLDFDIEIVEDVILRASFSKTITRPSYNDIKGGLTANSTQYFAGGNASASAGNPGLEPIMSRNLDLSAEWYYGDGSYLSIGYFDKDVDKFIGEGIGEAPLFNIPNIIGGALWDQAIAEGNLDPTKYTLVGQYILDNFQSSEYVDGDTISGAPGDPDLLWTLSIPVNQKKAKVDGLEINLQHNFGDSGYGMIANATIADADVGYDNMNSLEGQFVLNGLSDSANLVGFYDKDGLSVRLAYNWRDDFLAGAGQGQGTNTNPTNVEAYGQLDLGVTYEYSDRLTIYASGLNLTEETVHVYGLSKDQVLQAVQGGARYDLAIRYKLF
ncbi:MAG: TonB-dependent receptor [Porticoccaceae bacterium]|nr:TonB-dependent receptor [Porticoccaceae bacterium]